MQLFYKSLFMQSISTRLFHRTKLLIPSITLLIGTTLPLSHRALPSSATFGQRRAIHRLRRRIHINSSSINMNSSSSLSSSSSSHMEPSQDRCLPTTWDHLKHSNSLFTQNELVRRTIPILSSSSHKGSSGRVGILGGSERYTGAPYYAAMSALQTGVDLVYVFCAKEASIPIKSYSPELMVQSIYCAQDFDDMKKISNNNTHTMELNTETLVKNMADQVIDMLDRLHCLVIGPGLGRCPLVFQATSRIIHEAIHRDISLVLDADALFMLSMEEYHYLIQEFIHRPMGNTILTPNIVEYNRLVETIGNGSEQEMYLKMKNLILIRKGPQDKIDRFSISNCISSGVIGHMICEEKGGLKRCGGLGDILSGVLGAFTAWYHILQKRNTLKENSTSSMSNLVLSCWFACCVTKRATNQAFNLKKRSMTAPDVLKMIGEVMNEMASSSIQL